MRKLLNEELGRKSIDEFKAAGKSPIVVILDNVRSLNNIGSIFRTSDAFLIEKLYLCGITATPPHREIQKTALGATESVDWEYFAKTEEAVEVLLERGYQLVAVEQAENSIVLNAFVPEPDKKYALVFGNEVKGVEQSVVNKCQACIEIPQLGTKHSFNVAVSVGIVLWDISNKLPKQERQP
jgi:23S rRNA (guanosine2251-2'-O)-methyltransferase